MQVQLSEKEQQIRKIKNSQPIFIIGSQGSGASFLYQLIQDYLKTGFGNDNGNYLRIMRLLPQNENLNITENLKSILSAILEIADFKKRFSGLYINLDKFIENLEERSYPEIIRRFNAEWAYLKRKTRWGGIIADYAVQQFELFQLFPDAKFIHIIRDGRDVALSSCNQNKGAKDFFIAGSRWAQCVKAERDFGNTLSEYSYLEIRYEKLVQNPLSVFERLIHFIEYEGDSEAIIKRFGYEIEHKVKKDNFGKWEKSMPKQQIRTYEQAAGLLLAELGYRICYPEVLGKKAPFFKIALHQINNIVKQLFIRSESKPLRSIPIDSPTTAT